jgi:hypothetical protein
MLRRCGCSDAGLCAALPCAMIKFAQQGVGSSQQRDAEEEAELRTQRERAFAVSLEAEPELAADDAAPARAEAHAEARLALDRHG